MYDIGIVIVNYNVRDFLVQCLQSVRQTKTDGLRITVWVVDNASVDGAVTLLKQDFPEVQVIQNAENVGFSRANNQAIRMIEAKYILLLNPDTILEETTLQKCYDYMESHASAGALGVRMIDGNGKFLPESKRKIPDVWNSFCKLTYLSKIFPRSKWFSGYNLGYLPENKTAEIEVLCGAFMFIRKATLDKTGLLDERFFMYGEDIDLSYRILQAGYKIIYFPETSIIHFKGESTKKASLTYVRTFYGAMTLYVNKHYQGGKSVFFRWFILAAIQIRAFLSLLNKFLRFWVAVLVDAVFVYAILQGLKTWWAAYYFQDPQYYQGTAIEVNILIYTLIWVVSLWFFGRYDQTKKTVRLITGLLTGLALILMVYALESEEYRTSRALILLGSLAVAGFVLFSEWLKSVWSGPKKTNGAIVLVANKEDVGKIKNMLALESNAGNDLYIINPGKDEGDPFYTNHISNLDKTVYQLKADEIIFSSSSMPIKEIMDYMTKLSHHVAFKIAGDESLGIIGKKVPGKNLYSLDIHFPLEDGFWRRVKIISDVVLALLCIPLIPLIWVLNAGKNRAIRNIFQVIVQKKTWIGYGGDAADYRFLPDLPKAVIPYPMAYSYIQFQEGHFKNKNVEYAKGYSPFLDLALFFSNITNLYGR